MSQTTIWVSTAGAECDPGTRYCELELRRFSGGYDALDNAPPPRV